MPLRNRFPGPDAEPLSSRLLEPGVVKGFRVSVDRTQEPGKLAKGALEGHVRAWKGGSGGQYLIAITLERFARPSVAARFVRTETRKARGVLGRFEVQDVPGAKGLKVEKAGAMPDGRDGHGNVVMFDVGSIGVVISHLGPTMQPPEFIVGLAREQHRRLVEATQ